MIQGGEGYEVPPTKQCQLRVILTWRANFQKMCGWIYFGQWRPLGGGEE